MAREQPRRDVLREVTPEAIAEVRALIAGADHGALATLDPATGWPIASRVGLATLADGTPLIVASGLASHFEALVADPRCSLLIGVVGKGDPLAHPRVTIRCRARMIAAGTEEAGTARQSYLVKHPKSALYLDLPDFRLFGLGIVSARFNGGFGRAFEMDGATLTG